MYLYIYDQRVIGQIVGTFTKRPKTFIESIRICEGDDGYQIARIDYRNGMQRYHGKHTCVVEITVNDGTYLNFWCCKTRKEVKIKL